MKIRLVRILKDVVKNLSLKRYYTKAAPRAKNSKQWVIYMADGKMPHGGLSDRLCGLISTYQYCIEHDLTFKIYFCNPYDLSFFLLPNKSDLYVDLKDISYNSRDSEAVYISFRKDNAEQRKNAIKKLKSNRKQIHVYTNMRYFKGNFSILFADLFTLSDILNNAVERYLEQLDRNFISITFRFQQLLGDFLEGTFPVLQTDEEKKGLINKCVDCIVDLHNKHPEVQRILVTSDSTTFLDIVSKLDFVFVIPGKMVHVDFLNEEVAMESHLKSFVDLFVLAHASEIFMGKIGLCYGTSFPQTASLIYGAKYIIIWG